MPGHGRCGMAGHGRCRCGMASRSHPLLPPLPSPSPPLVARRPFARLLAVELSMLPRRCAGLVSRMASLCAGCSCCCCARCSSRSSVLACPHLSSPPLLACLDLLWWLRVSTPCPHLLCGLVPCPLPHPQPLVRENVTGVTRHLSSESSTR
jgi:hypothetical protein